MIRALAAGALALAFAAAGAAATDDPKAYVLQAQDLPAGFSFEQGKSVSGHDAVGQLTGYEADYTKSGVRNGLIRVASRAVVLSTPAAAHRLLALLYAHPPGSGVAYRRVAVSWRLGDESRLYLQSATGSASGVKLAVYLVLWRSGRVLGSVSGGGIAGTFSASEVVAVAREQQVRMRAA